MALDGREYPVSARLQGRVTLHIYRASDGVELRSDDNATFQATLVDGGDSGDSFALIVYDKRGVVFESVPAAPLQGLKRRRSPVANCF